MAWRKGSSAAESGSFGGRASLPGFGPNNWGAWHLTLCYPDTVKLELPRDAEIDAGVWYSTSASSWYPTHWHAELEVKLVLWGSTLYQVGADRVELGPGSLLWLAPGQKHKVLNTSDELSMWVASFRLPVVREAEKLAGVCVLDSASTWGALVLPAERVRELSGFHSKLSRCETPSLLNQWALRLLTYALSAWRAGRQSTNDGHQYLAPHPAVVSARTLLRVPGNNWPLASLSRHCGLESARLSRLFKQQMGLPTVQFRNHFRVQRFIAEFGHGDQHTMLEVALGSGFGSYPQFHRAFHRVTGYAPSEHLRRVRTGIVLPTHQSPKLPPGDI